MEQALNQVNTPDVIKSALDKNEVVTGPSKINEVTIDNLFGAPDKIVIPERYIPESVRRIVISRVFSRLFTFSFLILCSKRLRRKSARSG